MGNPKSSLEQMFESIDKKAAVGQSSADLKSLGKKVESRVGKFLTSKGMYKNISDDVMIANESINGETALAQCGEEALMTLVAECNIPEAYKATAAKQIGRIINRMSGASKPAYLMAQQNGKSPVQASGSLESIFSPAIVSTLISNEMIGVDIDKANSDMKTAITVAIMSFHTGLVPRVLPTKTVAQPNIQYTKEFLEVFDNASTDRIAAKTLLDLYEDPSTATNKLKKIVPLAANDSGNAYLVSDGVIKFSVTADILDLSIDSTKTGYTKINRTDIIADNVKLEKVYVQISDNGTPTKIDEVYEIVIPEVKGRITRTVNSELVSDRSASFTYVYDIEKTTKTSAGETSAILAGITAGEKVRFTLTLKPSINLATGMVNTLGSVTIAAVAASATAATSNAVKAVITNALAAGVVLTGYSLDARFSEENLRKTNIAVWEKRQPFSYDIPTGRNYIFDTMLNQESPESMATNLTKVIRIGQDDVALKLIIDGLQTAYNSIAQYQASVTSGAPLPEPGIPYVAGAIVRPTVFVDTFKVDDLNVIQDSNRSGDIKQRALTYLNAVTADLLQKSMFKQALADGSTVSFKMITSMQILANIFSQPHIHNHLENGNGTGKLSGVEYTLVLPNGVKIEVVTTTFLSMRTKMVMIPFIEGDAESVLNFAHNWDYGTVVSNYTAQTDGNSVNRLFASVREIPFIVNPVGAIIDITGLDNATYLGDTLVRPYIITKADE